ncbi:Serine dehydratase alpha chain [Providencia rustigianii]|nr:Serine dehydratase alpha chain [Providencia rustigianii]
MATETQSLLWQYFINAVKQDVKPALGCTEPISLAYAAAKAASYLQNPITKVVAFVSPNLMKNGMGVTVPGTGMVGLPIAAALGAIGGDGEAGLEVLKAASPEAIARSKGMLAEGLVTVDIKSPCDDVIYSEATVYSENDSATVVIAGSHTHIVKNNPW